MDGVICHASCMAITRIEDSSRSRAEEIFKYQRFQLFSNHFAAVRTYMKLIAPRPFGSQSRRPKKQGHSADSYVERMGVMTYGERNK